MSPIVAVRLVCQYNSAKDCTNADFMPFYIIGMLLQLVVFFVFPVPFGIGYICARRPRVSLLLMITVLG